MRTAVFRASLLSLGVLAMAPCGCTILPTKPPPAPVLQPSSPSPKAATVLPYADTEAFDLVFEAALRRGDAVIVVQTGQKGLEWQGRLNAWVAAWNEAAPLRERDRASRSLVELPADTAQQTATLINSQIDRIEGMAKRTVDWWRDTHRRKDRAALLRHYALNLEHDQSGQMQLVLSR